MRPIVIVALLAGALLAGCSSSPPAPSDSGPSFDDLDLHATDSTGVIRGVVVDDAIRPIAGAKVSLTGDHPAETASSALGTFGFQDLAPGTYFLKVHKAGYADAQQSVDVVANVAEPPAVKVQLLADASTAPYVSTYVFSGFIECMTPNVALCGLANDLGGEGGQENLTQDNSQVRYPLDRVPTWVQSEMVWDSTQALGGSMSLMYSWIEGTCDDPTFYCDHDVSGTSPLLLTANADDIAHIELGTTQPDLYIRTFTAPADPAPTVVGLTLQQSFTVYTHVFYGYQPPEGWRFSETGDVPQPDA